MRRIDHSDSDADSHLDGKIASFHDHLERCHNQFETVFSEESIEAALQTQDAQSIAQFSYTIKVLEGIRDDDGEDKWRKALSEWSAEAIALLRDSDAPRWKSLATATILEAIHECSRIET